jgi:tetratricopeptide (TPR) repeat protein
MIPEWFNSREAATRGIALADEFVLRATPTVAAAKKDFLAEEALPLQELLSRVARELRALELNFYKKAKLANSFKHRLIEKGVGREIADALTHTLKLHLSEESPEASSDDTSAAAPADPPHPGKVEGLLARANECFSKGDYAEAAARYRDFVELVPRRPDVLNTLGVALCNLGRYQEAEQRYREAIAIDPDFADALCNLATLLQGDPGEAEKWLRSALKASPRYPGAHTKLGIILAFTGRLDQAKEAFQIALQVDPNDSDALLGLGQIARSDGLFTEAEALIKRALTANPKLPTAWAALNGIRKMTSEDGEWLRGAEEIAGSGISVLEEAELRFAIGKYYDDVNNFEQAFQNYRRGNELLKTVAPKYDRQAHSRFADDMISVYTRETMAAAADGSMSTKPILVLGMPRSGTSLVEQIIASHPAAKGAGELDFWLNAARAHQSEIRRGILGASVRRKLAEEYLSLLERHCPDTLRVVDKTPTNSDHVGLIHSVFPNARIIRMRRNPVDTCLSCYFQHFSIAMTFTMDLTDLANYYQVHERLMKHWCNALPPSAVLELPYEELVANQEAWTRRILDFVGLEWDARCLLFHETERTVNTASAWQVRQKIHNQSVERWRNYEKLIGPLLGLRD